MNSRIIILALLIYTAPNLVIAVSESDFEVKNTKSLINLCTVNKNDPLYREAINFCHGYLVGAYHFYKVTHHSPDGMRLVCLPEPPPSRNEVFNKFNTWVKSHPEYMDEIPVDTEFRFLAEAWPCE